MALVALAYRWATPHPPPPEGAMVRRDPGDPRTGFRWDRLSRAYGLLAMLGAGALLAIGLLAGAG